MKGHTVRLGSTESLNRAWHILSNAPEGWLCKVVPPTRSNDQSAKMWAMLTDISIAKPNGRKLTPEQWKCIFMQACGWEVQFLEGLDGQPFPAGFRSSKMTVKQMTDLIEFIQAKGDEWGVRWSE